MVVRRAHDPLHGHCRPQKQPREVSPLDGTTPLLSATRPHTSGSGRSTLDGAARGLRSVRRARVSQRRRDRALHRSRVSHRCGRRHHAAAVLPVRRALVWEREGQQHPREYFSVVEKITVSNHNVDGSCLRGYGSMVNHAPASRANVQLVQGTMPSDAHMQEVTHHNKHRLVVDRKAPMYRRDRLGWRSVPAALAHCSCAHLFFGCQTAKECMPSETRVGHVARGGQTHSRRSRNLPPLWSQPPQHPPNGPPHVSTHVLIVRSSTL